MESEWKILRENFDESYKRESTKFFQSFFLNPIINDKIERENILKNLEAMTKDQQNGLKMLEEQKDGLFDAMIIVLNNFNQDVSQETTYIGDIVKHCEIGLKIFLSIYSSFPNLFSQLDFNDQNSKITKQFKSMLEVSLNILSNDKRTFECSQNAALSVIYLFKSICKTEDLTFQMINSFFSIEKSQKTIFDEIFSSSLPFSEDFEKNYSVVAKLSIYRALMIVLDAKDLIESINIYLSKLSPNRTKYTLFLDYIFPFIVNQCTPTSTNEVKFNGFQVLSVWNSKILQILENHKKNSIEEIFGMKMSLFSETIIEKMIEFSLRDWGDSEHVVLLIENRFTSLLELIDILESEVSKTQEEKTILQDTRDKITSSLTENQENKSLQKPLALMIKRYGSQIIKDKKSLVKRTFQGLKLTVGTKSQATFYLLFYLIFTVKEEMGKNTPIKDVIDETSKFWSDPVSELLLGDNENARNSCFSHIIPLLFQNLQDVYCATKILTLISDDCKKKNLTDITFSSVHLQAFLGVLKLLRFYLFIYIFII